MLSKLSLEVVGECTIYKKKDQVVISIDAIVKLDKNQESFVMVEQDKDLSIYLKEIGVKSLDELQ